MRRTIRTVLAALLILPAAALVRSQESKQQAPPQSVAEAARKAREAKKSAPQAKRVYTTDDVRGKAARGGVSVVGVVTPAQPTPGQAEGQPASSEEEALWRQRFAEAREKLRNAERELSILQRELVLLQQQYYSDPQTAMREQYDRREINEHTVKIEAKQKDIEAARKALSDLEEDLRRAGKPAGWSRAQ